MRVLYIDDDRMVGAAVVQALKDAAYAVDWVTDGESALHAAGTDEYQLVLLDLGLPEPDGLDVLRRIRKSLVTFGQRHGYLMRDWRAMPYADRLPAVIRECGRRFPFVASPRNLHRDRIGVGRHCK